MTTLAAIVADVFAMTNRPDLVSETNAAVRAATLKAHQSDFFYRDLVESGITWSTPAYVQSLSVATIFQRFRALKYLRKYSNGTAGTFFEVVSPENVLDSYSLARSDICYGAGASVEIKSSTLDTDMLIGFYAHPNVTAEGYSSWIADNYPFVIIYEACRVVFKMIGFDSQSASYEKLVAEAMQQLRLSNVSLLGE